MDDYRKLGYAILAGMKKGEYEPISTPVENDFWSAHHYLFTAKFPTYYNQPQKVWGRFHTSEEQYFGTSSEIIPLEHKKGKKTYIMMHPYVLEPKLTLTIGLYNKPKQYADQEDVIGKTISTPQLEGFREAQMGNAQAWYYHEDKTIVLWECFFNDRFMKHPLPTDVNMQHLWKRFELWLVKKFPKATTLATPFNDPIAESIDEYQSFLRKLGYSPIAQGAFGKKI
jgi:hypothetical protein